MRCFLQELITLTHLLDVVQVLGLLIKAIEKAFPKHICNILLLEAKTILESAVQLQDTVERGGISFWKEAYYSLFMIEKMLKQFPDLTFRKDLEVMYSVV